MKITWKLDCKTDDYELRRGLVEDRIYLNSYYFLINGPLTAARDGLNYRLFYKTSGGGNALMLKNFPSFEEAQSYANIFINRYAKLMNEDPQLTNRI